MPARVWAAVAVQMCGTVRPALLTFSAASTQCERRVHFVLDGQQQVEQHWPAVLYGHCVRLHARRTVSLRVVAVHAELIVAGRVPARLLVRCVLVTAGWRCRRVGVQTAGRVRGRCLCAAVSGRQRRSSGRGHVRLVETRSLGVVARSGRVSRLCHTSRCIHWRCGGCGRVVATPSVSGNERLKLLLLDRPALIERPTRPAVCSSRRRARTRRRMKRSGGVVVCHTAAVQRARLTTQRESGQGEGGDDAASRRRHCRQHRVGASGRSGAQAV